MCSEPEITLPHSHYSPVAVATFLCVLLISQHSAPGTGSNWPTSGDHTDPGRGGWTNMGTGITAGLGFWPRCVECSHPSSINTASQQSSERAGNGEEDFSHYKSPWFYETMVFLLTIICSSSGHCFLLHGERAVWPWASHLVFRGCAFPKA